MIIAGNNTGSTFGELSSFLSALNKKENRAQLFQRDRPAVDVQVLARHLEMQLPKNLPPVVFRRLGKHTQLTFQFGN